MVIQEDFLHFLWKFKYFAINKLKTTSNVEVQVLQVGEHNLNSGPDFFNSKLKIGVQIWAGNVEIHVKSSDWYVHQHEKDPNYDNVILHVVWKDDVDVIGKNNKAIPTLELYNIVSKDLISQYQTLFFKPKKWINCEFQISSIDDFIINNWLEVLFFERLEQKSKLIQTLLNACANDWEAVLFKILAKNFGLKVNGVSFLNLANSIDFKIIRKEQYSLKSLEALLFGQAGFLEENKEGIYYNKLQKDYKYLQLKYNLNPLFTGQFQFFRLRPNNFPTIRLAQLAMVYHKKPSLFSAILDSKNLEDFYRLFDVKISDFWQYHYSFNLSGVKRSKGISKSFVELLVINTIIPLKFMYLRKSGKLTLEELLDLSKQIKPERNSIIYNYETIFKKNSIANRRFKSAMESQALIQLKTAYCDKQFCLKCAIGNALLKRNKC